MQQQQSWLHSRNGYGYFAMQAHFGPTMDYKVRQAITHITDRQYVADVVLKVMDQSFILNMV